MWSPTPSSREGWPDICNMDCGGALPFCGDGWVDWDGCAPWAADCGLYNHTPQNGSFYRNPELRKPYTRHMGGSNCGFLDGHAAWINSERMLTLEKVGEPGGLGSWGPTTVCCGGFACGEFGDDYAVIY